VSLIQVGDMRASWKKMKAAGITSDIGLRYAYISGVKASGFVPCCCCFNTICCLKGACKSEKPLSLWLLFLKMSISHCASHIALSGSTLYRHCRDCVCDTMPCRWHCAHCPTTPSCSLSSQDTWSRQTKCCDRLKK